ncbi:MAG: uracil-DNA glycosylase [Myxococcota bacterium]
MSSEQAQRWLRDLRRVISAQAELGLTGVAIPERFLEVSRESEGSRGAAGRSERSSRRSSPRDATVVADDASATRTDRRRGAVADSGSGLPPTLGLLPELPSELASLSSTGADGLADVRAVLGECTRCPLHRGRGTIVFGVGDPQARLMFIGEAPGRDEDLQGEPFVGRAGQLLTRMIAAMSLRRDDVYIANIVKCRPPRNRDPEPNEVHSCEPFLKAQIRAIEPEVIVALGKYAAQTLLGRKTPISRLRGTWSSYEGIALMPTFHPAYLLRNPAEKRPVWQDLQAVMERLGVPRS